MVQAVQPASLNRVTIIGSLERVPELRYTPAGRPVACFCVKTSRAWTDADGASHEQTEAFNVVTWGELAEFCRGQLSGSQSVYVEGRLQTRSWDEPGGSTCSRLELVASQVVPLQTERDSGMP